MPPPSLSPTAPKQGVIRARVDADVEQAFAALAKQRGMKTSELLRWLILAEIDAPSTPAPVIPSPEKSDLSQMTVRVPAFLYEAIRERAAARGMAVGRWVASLIQSNLVAHPVLTNEEILAVLSVQRELNAVGRNVNQIARHLNENFHETERVRLDVLSQLATTIAGTKRVINSLVRSSRQVWKAEAP